MNFPLHWSISLHFRLQQPINFLQKVAVILSHSSFRKPHKSLSTVYAPWSSKDQPFDFSFTWLVKVKNFFYKKDVACISSMHLELSPLDKFGRYVALTED